MKSSIGDKVEEAFHELEGTAREAAEILSDNPKLKLKGIIERIASRSQEKIRQFKNAMEK